MCDVELKQNLIALQDIDASEGGVEILKMVRGYQDGWSSSGLVVFVVDKFDSEHCARLEPYGVQLCTYTNIREKQRPVGVLVLP